jgi:pyridinium-3,5-biscarboxylic acid mononucleotide synthase
MDERLLRDLLESVQRGDTPIDGALERLRVLPFEQVGDFAHIDTHRQLRCGFPEVVFGQGKTPEQVAQIVRRLAAHSERVMVTRATPEMLASVQAAAGEDSLPEPVYHDRARVIVLEKAPRTDLLTGVLVVTGGTSDLPVAEEAALTAEMLGNQVERLYDVGVAGLHRLLGKAEALRKAHAIVVAAGMEGALASVVGGLVTAPVIAVPTSIGYGASFGGLAALLAMLNSCATGVAVVNIDNGFGAGYMAGIINRLRGSS